MDIDTRVAEQFGKAIAQGDFAAAHALLTIQAQRSHSPGTLKQSVEHMLANSDGPIQHVEVMKECVLAEWADKRDGDVAYVYVALSGDSFSEAATVVLATEAGAIRIREIEWGRP